MQPVNRPVDRGFVKAVAYKRTLTGALSLVGAVVMTAMAMSRGDRSLLPLAAAVIFVVSGSWALRDGLRLFRDLRVGSER